MPVCGWKVGDGFASCCCNNDAADMHAVLPQKSTGAVEMLPVSDERSASMALTIL